MTSFSLDHEDSLIIVPSFVNDEEVSLVLDTGASHTIVDLTKLLIAGYDLRQNRGIVEFETAKGVVEAYVFDIDRLSALGITKHNVKICSYDFLGNNVLSDIDGVLGLDFFKNTEMFISFRRFFIDLKV